MSDGTNAYGLVRCSTTCVLCKPGCHKMRSFVAMRQIRPTTNILLPVDAAVLVSLLPGSRSVNNDAVMPIPIKMQSSGNT